MELLGYGLAALIGLSLGLMGGGGSILTVPILVYVLGFDPKLSIAMSLPIVGVTSLVGAARHWRLGNVNLKTAALFGVLAMIGAYGGALLAVFLSGAAQLALLAVTMLAAAGSMLRSARSGADRSAHDARAIPPGLMIPVAGGVGLLTGLVGIGGGFLIVPALVVLARVPMKQAVGTSLLVIAMNAASGFAGYLGSVDIPWGFVAAFTAVAVGGIAVGTHLARFVDQAALKRAFAVFLLLMGALILYGNRDVLRPHLASLDNQPFLSCCSSASTTPSSRRPAT